MTTVRRRVVVEVFEGPELEVGAMVEWCRRVPPRATVTSTKIADEAPEGLATFRITS